MNNEQFLVTALKNQRLFHAYILTGTAINKKLAAIYKLAKLINCESKSACDVCSSCVQINHQTSSAIYEVNTLTEVISKEMIKSACDFIEFKSAYTKFIIIHDAYKMNRHAQNTLLKTLEDLYDNVYIFLLTPSASQLLPTVVSRCVCLDFSITTEFKNRKEQAMAALSNLDIKNDQDIERFESIYDVATSVFNLYLEGEMAYLLDELCYNKISKRDEAIDLLTIILVLCEDSLHNDYDNGRILKLIEQLFIGLKMLKQNVNVKLAIDFVFIEGC